MGIRRLTTRLNARAQWVSREGQLRNSNVNDTNPDERDIEQKSPKQPAGQTPPEVAIIDGPNLVWHIYNEYRHTKPDAQSGLTYNDVGRRTIALLEDLETTGLQIHAIYFDGLLPAAKQKTRKDRIEWSQRSLEVARRESQGQRSLQLLGAGKSWPPPFIIPSAIETLLNSQFGARVKVVPGEADSYCANEATALDDATENLVTIISDDSDLIIQPCGIRTGIMMLSGLTSTRTPTHVKLDAQVFAPDQLAKQVGLPNLITTAFFMSQDIYLSFNSAVVKAKKCSSDQHAQNELTKEHDYKDFMEGLSEPTYSTTGLPAPITEVLQRMDPRIAELAHQMMPGFPRQALSPSRVFLAPLIEDVTRTTAWQCGREIRHTAYQMIESTRGTDQNIYESMRKGTTLSWTHIEPSSEWRGTLLRYMQDLQSTKGFLLEYGATTAQWFNYLGMYYAIQDLASVGERLTQEEVVRALARGCFRYLEDLHLSARCQAAIYSLRILKQLLALREALENGLDEDLAVLGELLGEMPPLVEVMEKSEKDTEEVWGVLAEGLLGTVDWS